MEAAILRQIKGMGNMTGSGGSFTDDVQGFLHAIDWTEPFLKGKRTRGSRHRSDGRTSTDIAASAARARRPASLLTPTACHIL